jgi:rhamnosyltransferase
MSDTTILIRSLNEGDHIDETLSAIMEQSGERPDIVLVDSYSDDDTVEIARSYGAIVKQISREKFTYGKGMNVGMAAADTRYVVSLSAHAVPTDRYWLQELIDSIEPEDVAGAYGRQVAGPDAHALERRELINHYGVSPRDQQQDPEFSNANAIIDRRVWMEHKFVQNEGFRIRYTPDAAVYHTHDDSLRQLFHRNYNEGRAMNLIDEECTVGFTSLVGGTLLDLIRDTRFVLEERSTPHSLAYAPIYRFTQKLGLVAGYYDIGK